MPARHRRRRFGLFGPAVLPVLVPSRKRLLVEPLEDRRMMNGDHPLAGGPQPPEAAGGVVAAAANPLATEQSDVFLDRDELRQWLIQVADERWGALFGHRTSWWGWHWGWTGDVAILRQGLAMAFATNSGANAVADAASDAYSGTNAQVAGVDEADIVETDGAYLYVASGRLLTIVELGDGAGLSVAAQVQLDHEVAGMYLDGDRLAIVSKSSPEGDRPGDVPVSPAIGQFVDGDLSGQPSPQADPSDRRRGPTTTVTLLDVSDRTAPALVKRTELDGRYVASRSVAGQLRLVVENGFSLPQPLARPVDGASTPAFAESNPTTPLMDGAVRLTIADYFIPGEMQDYVYETRDEYIERVIDEMLDTLPALREIGLGGDIVAESPLATPDRIFRPEDSGFTALTTVVSIDMHGRGGVEDARSILAGSGATVYATAEHLYLLAGAHETGMWSTNIWLGGHETTRIWKFGFGRESHEVKLAARGQVEGTLLNQFAVDEHEGRLRVVTSGPWNEGQQLFVLGQTGKRLSAVGHVGGMAPGEVVHSVRFLGDRAFLVTFRQVDPLFALDLSDPENPRVEGELKIPGYSEYLQPLDANHLIGIGRGANESTGLFEELQVSIFDVTDLDNPKLVHRYSFGGGRSTSTIATGDRWTRGDGDHHAVGYYADQGLLTLPISSDDAFAWWGEAADDPLFELGHGGVQVFRISAEGGLVAAALIEHATLIHRTVLAGDRLLAISPGTISAHALDDPASAVATLELGEVAETTPLVAYVAPAPAAATEMFATLGAEADPAFAGNLPPSLAQLYAVVQPDGLGAQFRSGRDAAMVQLARARTFGNVVVPHVSPLAAQALAALDEAFAAAPVDPAEDSAPASAAELGGRLLASAIVPQLV